MKKDAVKRIAAAVVCVAILVAAVSFDRMQSPILFISDCANSVEAAIPKITVDKTTETFVTTHNTTTTTAPPPAKSQTTATAPQTKAAASNAAGKIKVETLEMNGKTNVSDIHIANKTSTTVDVAKQLSIKPDFKIYKNSKPQVLVMHTHATECYFPKESDVYYDNWQTRTTDAAKNTVAIGQIITDRLNEAGIAALHDTTQHDAQSYSGSYERARETINSYLEKYPSIDVVLDIHRDAITYDNGTKLCPIAQINGKSAAQIMICTGCNSDGVTEHKNWLENFRFAIRLQQSCEKNFPLLARPLYFVAKRYNHDLTAGSLLIEVGSEANTLEQAKYSAELLAKALIPVLNGLQ